MSFPLTNGDLNHNYVKVYQRVAKNFASDPLKAECSLRKPLNIRTVFHLLAAMFTWSLELAMAFVLKWHGKDVKNYISGWWLTYSSEKY